MDTTGKVFVEHWTWAADKGVMKRNTANALKTASFQVLSVMDDWENVDIKTLDIDDVLNRFQNLRSKDYKPKTLQVYQRRFRQAVSDFLDYIDNPADWKPTGRSSYSGTTKINNNEQNQEKKDSSEKSNSLMQIEPKPGLVQYPYPLRENLVVVLNLPADLTSTEVRRLAAFMNTLTIDFNVSDPFSN